MEHGVNVALLYIKQSEDLLRLVSHIQ